MVMENTAFKRGQFESQKYSKSRGAFHDRMAKIEKMTYSFQELIEYFLAFAGEMTLRELVTKHKIQTMPAGWMPTAFIEKQGEIL